MSASVELDYLQYFLLSGYRGHDGEKRSRIVGEPDDIVVATVISYQNLWTRNTSLDPSSGIRRSMLQVVSLVHLHRSF